MEMAQPPGHTGAAPVDPLPGSSDDAARRHIPVMRDRIVSVLAEPLSRPGLTTYVDGTLGMGGHAQAILSAHPGARLVGIDRDPEALRLAAARLAGFGDRVHLARAVFDELPRVLDRLGIAQVDAILLDLGLSSLQIDETGRGFSYMSDSPLDMRMDPDQPLTAAQILNERPASELTRIFRTYGEEPFAQRIAGRIVAARGEEPFVNAARLVEVISAAIPMAARKGRGHPAKRVFQALRIEVNGELDALRRALPAALDALSVGGRLAVLAYHSLEDRMVKQLFAAASSDTAPAGLPVVPESMRARFRLVTRGAERPEADEVSVNPRSASARLRVIERVREAA